VTLATSFATRENRLCKKCAAVLLANVGDVPGEVEIDVAATCLGLERPLGAAAHTSHNATATRLGKAEARAAREVRRVLHSVLQRVAGERVYLTPGELLERRRHQPLGAIHPADCVMEMERRSHEIERRAGERVAAECEAVLQRVLRQVERRVAGEEQAAARAASIQAKQRRRDEIEVRATLDALLGRLERELTRQAKEVAKGAAKEETARTRQAQREERARLQEQQKVDKVARGGGKRQRCGACAGCRAGNCGKCASCLDMPRFGGTGSRRQPCKYRACSELAVQEVVSTWLQCDHPTCLKWRIVPELPGVVPEDDEPWYCELNRDPARNTCEAPQQPDDATLDEAVLALLAEADPDRDPDEDGDEPITDGLPPTPPLPSTAPADAPASAAAAAAAAAPPPSASEEPAAPSASPPAAAPSGRRSSGRAKAEEPAPAPTSPPEPPTKAGQKGTKGTKGTKDKEEAALAQPKPPKPKPKPKAVAAPVLMARVEVALGEADMASWYQARYYVSVLPWAKTLVTLRCKLKSCSGLALGPLGAPEYESRVSSRSRVPLPTFFCRSDHPEWWSLAEVHGCLDVDSPNP